MANRRITRPPGPEPHFLIGNFPLGRPDPLAVFTGWAREFGDIFYYRAGWIHVYFLKSPELIESVVVTNQQNFRKDRVIQNSRWFLGQGLLTSEGGEWLRQRRLSQPAFHRERLRSENDNGDLLSMLMSARDEDGSRMTDRQLRDEVMTFLLAGHETTALSLSWAWFLLTENPEAENKLHHELGHVLGGKNPS